MVFVLLLFMFVFYLVNEKFPQKTTEVNVAHIIDFENKYRPFSVDGHGRTFLLGLYFCSCVLLL